MSRKKARDAAVQILYAAEVHSDLSIEFISAEISNYVTHDYDLERPPLDNEEYNFALSICEGVVNNLNTIDELINANSSEWGLDRIGRVDLSILRIAVYELLYRKDIPVSVVVNEAIENAKKYCKEDSYKFVNGVLGAVAKKGDSIE